MGRGDSDRWEDGQGDGDECNSSDEVDGTGKGDAVQLEDGWGDGDEHNSSSEVGGIGKGNDTNHVNL